MNYTVFDHIASFDEGKQIASHQAAAVAHKRVSDTVGGYLKIAKSPKEYAARLDFVAGDIQRIVADVAEEYDADVDALQKAIDDGLKGDGVTDLTESLEDAPSAVGHGKQSSDEPDDRYDESGVYHCPNCESEMEEGGTCPNCGYSKEHPEDTPLDEQIRGKQSAGHKDGCECGFCKNKGNLPGSDSESEGDAEDEGSSVEASTRVADAPRDGGGAVKRESLPKGDGKSIGTEPSPKTDHRTWKPNALNDSTNTPPIDTEQSDSPNPTKKQDVSDDPDYKGDFLRDTDAVTESQTLPTADESGASTERNISQEGQGGTWTEAQGNPVTSATKDPDANPLKAILDNGFVADNTVESAIEKFDTEKE